MSSNQVSNFAVLSANVKICSVAFMLVEQFIASIGNPSKAAGAGVVKDAAIFVQEFQPLQIQRVACKKSTTPPNCLALSKTHIFAAQSDKSAIHIYSREKGIQEATVPFPERISALTLACDDSVLVFGTEEGRVHLWEICSGRQITAQQSHLQAVTSLAVDATSNFLASASKDSTIYLWSLTTLLSFGRNLQDAFLQSFASHRDQVTDIQLGHSAWHTNFAVSISRDKTCLIWDYQTNGVLRTYLLPEVPLCLTLDPADRAVYIGYEDGSIQQIDVFARPRGAREAIRESTDAAVPVQLSKSSCWNLSDHSHGAVTSLSPSFDGSKLVSGHQSGSVISWDVGKGSYSATLSTLPGPVNNLSFLPLTGFDKQFFTSENVSNVEIVKPKFGAFDISDEAVIPENYSLNVQLLSSSDARFAHGSEYSSALFSSVFSDALIDEGLNELQAWRKPSNGSVNGHDVGNVDPNGNEGNGFISFDDSTTRASGQHTDLLAENAHLKAQIDALRRVQAKSFDKIEKLSDERHALMQRVQRLAAEHESDESDG